MTLKTEFMLELHKLRHRRVPLMFLALFAILALWLMWCMDDVDPSRFNDVGALLYINLLLMNTILCPIILAALASRMCDMEQLGNTYKWLCTIERPEHIYRAKALTGGFYVAVLCLMQTVLYHILLLPYGGSPRGRLASLAVTLALTALCIFILQLNLSLRCTNQLTPIFLNIGGTFIGLFSWFLPQWPLRYLLPWGYYAALCNTGYFYDKAARYTTYYWDSYPFFWLLLLAAVTAALYLRGRNNFLKTVRETM